MSSTGAALVLFIMAFTTFLTRIAGVALMSVVPMGPTVGRFLTALSGSVLVALVAPALVSGDWSLRIGAVVCLLRNTGGITTVPSYTF